MSDILWQERRDFACQANLTTDLTAWAADICAQHGIAAAASAGLQLVLEELFANLVKHGGVDGASKPVDICLSGSEGIVQIDWNDFGAAFDPFTPTETEDAHWEEEDVEARPVGGLGLHLVRSICTTVRRMPRDTGNHLIMTLVTVP